MLKSLATALFFVLLSSPTYAVMTVMNAGANAPVLTPGACTPPLTRTMANRGTVIASGVGTASIGVFRAAPFEGSGRGYGLTSDSVANTTTLVNFDLSGTLLIQTGQIQVSVTPNNPDQGNAIRAVLYDGVFLNAGFQSGFAPCGGTPCLHLRSYVGLVTNFNATYPGQVPVVSAFNALIADSATSTLWAAYTLGGVVKLNSAFTVIGSAAPATVASSLDLASDGGSVYAPYVDTGILHIQKINIGSLVGTDLTIPSSVAAGGITFGNGLLYVGATRGGVGQAFTINTTTAAVISSVSFGATETVLGGGMSVDPFNTKLYVVTNDGGTGARIRRINANTLGIEQTLLVAEIPERQGVGFDFAKQRLYFSSISAGQFRVTQVDLCS